jgi:hypothetical protein
MSHTQTCSLASLVSLAPLALLVLACGTDAPTYANEGVPGPLLHSFANSEWSPPVNLGAVNSPFNEQNVFLSKDELTLYFTSDRPGGLGDLDIWVSQRASVDSPWPPPVNLGPPINTPAADLAPNLSVDGHLLFFASSRPGGQGTTDIYVSRRSDPNDDFAWEDPVNVGAPINTADQESAPFYLQNAEDGPANLYFNRGPLALQQSNIYYASVTRKGEAQGPVVFVAELNHPAFNDAAPTIRQDGREIFFFSTRTGSLGSTDLWTSTRQSIHHPWEPPINAGAPLNTVFQDNTPHLSFDGRTLIFGSDRPIGLGGRDLWMSTRTRSGK